MVLCHIQPPPPSLTPVLRLTARHQGRQEPPGGQISLFYRNPCSAIESGTHPKNKRMENLKVSLIVSFLAHDPAHSRRPINAPNGQGCLTPPAAPGISEGDAGKGLQGPRQSAQAVLRMRSLPYRTSRCDESGDGKGHSGKGHSARKGRGAGRDMAGGMWSVENQ